MGERHLKHLLPFLDGLELAKSEQMAKAVCSAIKDLNLWETLCQSYLKEELTNQSDRKVPWPPRGEGMCARRYFAQIWEFYHLVQNNEVEQCQDCPKWTAVNGDGGGLDCEVCGGHWCDDCAPRGPDKRFVPCKDCPDFSLTHCNECFAEGKTHHCECMGTDSWHGCCGRHSFNCPDCDAILCDGCNQRHECSGQEEEEEEV